MTKKTTFSRALTASLIQDWVTYYATSSRTEPSYKAMALLTVLNADGPRSLAAVLEKLKLERTQDLIESMRDG